MATEPYFAGREGELGITTSSSIATVSFGKLTNFRVFANHTLIPVTNFDSSAWEENIDGTKSWGMTAEAMAVSTAGSTSHEDLRVVLSGGSRRWFSVAQSSTTATAGFHWKGYGYVEDWDLSGDEGGPQVTNFSIKGDGAYVESST